MRQGESQRLGQVPGVVHVRRTKAFWITLTGGVFVGIGFLLQCTLSMAFAFSGESPLTGGPLVSGASIRTFETITAVGEALAAIGFLMGFAGIALGLRAPIPEPKPALGRSTFYTILSGGVVTCLGLGLWGGATLLGTDGYPLALTGYYAFVSAAIVLEGIGFLVAFFGTSLAFRASA